MVVGWFVHLDLLYHLMYFGRNVFFKLYPARLPACLRVFVRKKVNKRESEWKRHFICVGMLSFLYAVLRVARVKSFNTR